MGENTKNTKIQFLKKEIQMAKTYEKMFNLMNSKEKANQR